MPIEASSGPGAALKALRTQKALTLKEVSLRTDLPISTLSKIENGKLSVTYDKLAIITSSLGVDMAELLAPRDADDRREAELSGRRTIDRAGEGGLLETHNYKHLYLAAGLLKKRFVPMIAELRARTLEEFGPMLRHTGDEFTFVLQGEVELHTDLYAPTILRAGDSIYFDSGTAHAYLAVGNEPARVLTICSGPESELREVLTGAEPTPEQDETVERPRRRRG
jgi:transcriptional regulator with XRE-family HTH domain